MPHGNLTLTLLCVCPCSDKGMRLSPRGVDNDMWEWIRRLDQWNKAKHVNLLVSMKRTVTVMKCWINDPVYLYIALRPHGSYNLIMKKRETLLLCLCVACCCSLKMMMKRLY